MKTDLMVHQEKMVHLDHRDLLVMPVLWEPKAHQELQAGKDPWD